MAQPPATPDLVVPGHHLNDDGTMRPILERRLQAALELFGRDPLRIVVTGGMPTNGLTEASVMRAYLLARGVPEDHILVEDRSRTTIENAICTKELGVENPLLVTNAYHLPKLRLVFRAVYGREIPGVAVPTDFCDPRERIELLLQPLSYAKGLWQTHRLHKQFAQGKL